MLASEERDETVSDYVLFQMSSWHRKSLIDGHHFYVDQARKRLLSQFDNIEAEADKASDDWLERSSDRFDPDRHDPADFFEAANEVGIGFYGLLSGMREQTFLNIVAGMFQEWDKQLRSWLVNELKRWHRGENFPRKIWSADFYQISGFLEAIGWKIHEADFFPKLDACRLLVNVYKDGDGSSLDDLKDKYPEHLHDPFNGMGFDVPGRDFRDHTNLKVSLDQFQAFSEAIAAFWTEIPENIWQSKIGGVPDWVEKAILKDRPTSMERATNEQRLSRFLAK